MLPPALTQMFLFKMFIPFIAKNLLFRFVGGSVNLAMFSVAPGVVLFRTVIVDLIPWFVSLIARPFYKNGKKLYAFIKKFGRVFGAAVAGFVFGGIGMLGPLGALTGALAGGGVGFVYYHWDFIVGILKNLIWPETEEAGDEEADDQHWERYIDMVHREYLEDVNLDDEEEEGESGVSAKIGADGDVVTLGGGEARNARSAIVEALKTLFEDVIGGVVGSAFSRIVLPFARNPTLLSMMAMVRKFLSWTFANEFLENNPFYTPEAASALAGAGPAVGAGVSAFETVTAPWLSKVQEYFSSDMRGRVPILDEDALDLPTDGGGTAADIQENIRKPSGRRMEDSGPYASLMRPEKRLGRDHAFWSRTNPNKIVQGLLKLATFKEQEEQEEEGEAVPRHHVQDEETPFYDLEAYRVDEGTILGKGILVQWFDRPHRRVPVDFYPKLNWERHLSFLENAGTLSQYSVLEARRCEANLLEDIGKMAPTGSLSNRPLLTVVLAVAGLVGGTVAKKRVNEDVYEHLQMHDERSLGMLRAVYRPALRATTVYSDSDTRAHRRWMAIATTLRQSGKLISRTFRNLLQRPSVSAMNTFSGLFRTHLTGRYYAFLGKNHSGIYRDTDAPWGKTRPDAEVVFSEEETNPDLVVFYQYALFMHYLVKRLNFKMPRGKDEPIEEEGGAITETGFRNAVFGADTDAVTHLTKLLPALGIVKEASSEEKPTEEPARPLGERWRYVPKTTREQEYTLESDLPSALRPEEQKGVLIPVRPRYWTGTGAGGDTFFSDTVGLVNMGNDSIVTFNKLGELTYGDEGMELGGAGTDRTLLYHQLIVSWFVQDRETFEGGTSKEHNRLPPIGDAVDALHMNEVAASRILHDIENEADNGDVEVVSDLVVRQFGPARTIEVNRILLRRVSNYRSLLDSPDVEIGEPPERLGDNPGSEALLAAKADMERYFRQVNDVQALADSVVYASRFTNNAILPNIEDAMLWRDPETRKKMTDGLMQRTTDVIANHLEQAFHPELPERRWLRRPAYWDYRSTAVADLSSMKLLLQFVQTAFANLNKALDVPRLRKNAAIKLVMLVNAAKDDLKDLFTKLANYARRKIEEASKMEFDKSLSNDLESLNAKTLPIKRVQEAAMEFMDLANTASAHYYVMPMRWEYEEPDLTAEGEDRSMMLSVLRKRNDAFMRDKLSTQFRHTVGGVRDMPSDVQQTVAAVENVEDDSQARFWLDEEILAHRKSARRAKKRIAELEAELGDV